MINRDKSEKTLKTKTTDFKKDVTAIIITLNEEDNIESCIKSIQKNEIKKIILVDASSKDKTVQIAKKFGVVCYIVPKKTIAYQRQYGADLVKTKYLFYVDADNSLEDDCIKKLVDYMESNNFVGVAAQKLRLKNMKDYWSMGWEWHNKTRLYTLGEKMVIGTPALYLTKVIKKVRYDIDSVSADDNTLCYKLNKQGLKVGVGDGICRESMVTTFTDFKKKLLGYGKGDAEFFLNFPERRWNMGTHMLRNYFLRGIYFSTKFGRPDLIPYYILYSVIRYYGFLRVLYQKKIMKSESLIHPGYT